MMITEEDLKANPKMNKLVQKALAKEEKFIYIKNSPYKSVAPNIMIPIHGELSTIIVPLKKSLYIFDITPIGKPRMTRRDKWKNTRTKAASKYMAWRNEFEQLISDQNFVLGDGVQVVFLLPFPGTWTKRKCDDMRGMPHQTKPDADNMLKGFIDVCCKTDQKIYEKDVLKFWWDTGKIIVVRNKPLYQNLMQIDTVYNAIRGTK